MKKTISLLALASIPALAADDAATLIGTARTDILAIVGLAGGALLAIAAAGVGFKVGARWISRLGSRG